MERPNLERLVDAALAIAVAIGYHEPDRAQTARSLESLLYKSQQEGGRELWGCYIARLITQTELRDALIARLSIELAHLDGIEEPNATQWLSRELGHSFEAALFGTV
jgi:hypothetical protein